MRGLKFLFASSVLLFSVITQAQITSTFDTNADGWTFSDQNLNQQTVTYNSTGGNPGGHVSSVIGGQVYYWTSPSKFNGSIAYFSYGQILSFDLQNPVTPTIHGLYGYDVAIRLPGGGELVYTLPTLPAVAPLWSSHSVRLDETAVWRVGSTTGPIATKEQIRQYLSEVASLRINGKYVSSSTGPSASLDNVRLDQRTIQLAPAITSISPTSGRAGTSITINGSGFGTNATNNKVFFGGMAATINTASSTQLTVTVPIGASLDKVSVTNKSTGLTTFSSQLFIPTFENGGRLIPASFGTRKDIALSSGTRVGGVAIADLDGDGWNELIAGEHGSNSVVIFPNLGDGGDLSASSFGSKISLSGGSNGYGPIAKDLDGDGKLDLLCGSNDSFNYFATFRNISTPGNIAFEAVELWAGLVYSGFITACDDVDGDGLIDLIGQHGNGSASPDFWIAQNLSIPGNIEFNTSISFFGSTTLDAGAGVSTGDLNNDGKPDFVVKHGFGGSFSIIENTSIPGTISLATPILFSEPSQGDIRIADLNQDGKSEIIFAELYNGDDVQIKINTHITGPITAADFQTEIALKSELFYSSGGVSVSDLNGDGKLDIILTDPNNLGFFENVYAGGAFTSNSFVEAYISDGGGSYPLAPISGDLNGDGRPDVAFGITNAAARVSLFQNKNVHTPVISLNTVSPLKGTVGSTVTITGDYFSIIPSENKVMFGDVQATVTSATKTQLTVTVPAGASIAAVSVTKDQLTATYHLPFVPTFSPGVTFNNTHFAPPVNFTLTGAVFDLDAGDVNNDGKPDLVAEGQSASSYAFRNTHTSGSITNSSLLADDTISGGAYYPHLIDLDGDGNLEVLTSGGPRRNISAGSEINFDASIYISPASNYFNGFADFNRDGKTDFVGIYNGTDIAIHENRTSVGPFIPNNATIPTFSAANYFTKPASGGSVIAVDFDKDGLTDFAATNPGTDNVSVWRNTGAYRISTTQFTVQPNITVGDNPARIYEGDLDVDGKVDILLYYGSGTTSTMLTVLHNESTVGNITFTRFDFAIPAAATVAHISDLDGDGKPDILVTSGSTNQFFIIKNTSTAGAINASSFAAPFNIAVNNPRGIITADLNLDGKPEIIITAAPNSLLVYENLIPNVTIAITTQPSDFVTCVGSIATFNAAATGTTNITYQWQFSVDGVAPFTDVSNGGGYTGTNTTTLTVNTTGNFGAGRYRCKISGDLATPVFTFDEGLFINPIPVAPVTTGASSCISSSVSLTASGGSNGQYRWYTTATGGSAIAGEVNSIYITPVISTTTTYFVSINNGSCESLRTPVVATINHPPATPTITSSIPASGNALTICSTTSLTLSAPAGFSFYNWSNGATNVQITVSSTDSYSVTVTDAGGCVSPASAAFVVTVQQAPCSNQAPVISTTTSSTIIGGQTTINLLDLISDTDNNLVLSSLTIVQQLTSGASAIITNGILEIDYKGVNFSGRDQLTIQVCDAFGECTQQVLEIDVLGDIEVYNALSPNGDDQNEIFLIRYIDLLPETQNNTIAIYNRWGSQVFEVDNYNNTTNVFNGLNNNGNELPSGTYFYKIKFHSPQTTSRKTEGYLVLKR